VSGDDAEITDLSGGNGGASSGSNTGGND